MKKALTYQAVDQLYHVKDGVRVGGVHDGIRGNVDGIWGNVDGIEGNVDGIEGNVSGIRGNVTDIWGDATFISGNLDNCDLSQEDRDKGVNIKDLIGV